MNTFHLTIVTPDGCKFDGDVESVQMPASEGSVQVLAHHVNYVTTLGMGPASVGSDGEHRKAACIGGMFSITDNVARLIAASFEWADEIDVDRAKAALKRAEAQLEKADIFPAEKTLAEAAKARALVRLSLCDAKKD
ncbi:MAG: ATP synthase F1 subunit epsilon [Firmicutes bacterium]|jgi:F-type H+-transporting ATPase subunit epsilon|nr:ATP synthase F1 subunit epsilon [Bacillota bacterium]